MWTEIEKNPLGGELNTNYFTLPPPYIVPDRIHLMRVPRSNHFLIDSITEEYAGIGFIGPGKGSFSRRSPAEQGQLYQTAKKRGLMVLQPTDKIGSIQYFPFFPEAKTIDDFLKEATRDQIERVVSGYFMDLWKAHKAGIVYGDRWPPNILVQGGEAINIDFDLNLKGPTCKEFEASQVVYYLLKATSVDISPLLAVLVRMSQNLDLMWFTFFLRGHARYFEMTEKSGMENEVELFIHTLKSSHFSSF